MKKLILFGLIFATSAFADNCRVTSASIERNGQFENETVTVCKEGFEQVPKIKIGDTILETEVGKSNVKVHNVDCLVSAIPKMANLQYTTELFAKLIIVQQIGSLLINGKINS